MTHNAANEPIQNDYDDQPWQAGEQSRNQRLMKIAGALYWSVGIAHMISFLSFFFGLSTDVFNCGVIGWFFSVLIGIYFCNAGYNHWQCRFGIPFGFMIVALFLGLYSLMVGCHLKILWFLPPFANLNIGQFVSGMFATLIGVATIGATVVSLLANSKHHRYQGEQLLRNDTPLADVKSDPIEKPIASTEISEAEPPPAPPAT